MARPLKTIDYDDEYDILYVHKGFEKDEKFKGNVAVGDVILDVSTKGHVRGFEILRATKFLQEFLKGQSLENVKDADFTVTVRPSGITLKIILKTKKMVSATIAIPLADRYEELVASS